MINYSSSASFHYTHQYLQVTNQMITACKAYITNNGSNSIWDQPQQVVADKIKAAIHLNQVLDTVVSLLHTVAVSCVKIRQKHLYVSWEKKKSLQCVIIRCFVNLSKLSQRMREDTAVAIAMI